jgi:hypothetical protein
MGFLNQSSRFEVTVLIKSVTLLPIVEWLIDVFGKYQVGNLFCCEPVELVPGGTHT